MASNSKQISLKNITLIDGSGNQPRAAVDLIIEDGRIKGVENTQDHTDGRQEVDFSGGFVIPGLIDCHVHLSLDGAASGEVTGSPELVILKMLKHAHNCLASGITTMRDVGGWHHLEFALRSSFETGVWTGPRLALAGRLLSITSSGATLYPGMYREADGASEVRKAAREQFKAGADLIKLMASGAVMAQGEKPEATQYSVEEMEAAVDEARKIGKTVAAHAHAAAAIRNAVQAGVNSIEHGTFLYRDPAVMEEMIRKNIYLVPTLKVFHGMSKEEGIPGWMLDKAKYVAEHHSKSISEAIKEGVLIAMGTDSATPYNYHGSNAEELMLMVDCGMSPMQAIVSSTANGAKLLGWDDWLGTLEPGKVADLVVLTKNPLDDISVLAQKENIAMVMQQGRMVARKHLADVAEHESHSRFICCEIP